jgi:hypothetical protein
VVPTAASLLLEFLNPFGSLCFGEVRVELLAGLSA